MLPIRKETLSWILLLLSLVTLTQTSPSNDARVVCYYTNWSIYRPGTAKFSPQNINPYLCTHLIYAFGGFTKDNNLKPFDKYQDIEKGGYAKFNGLKSYNKNLKTLLAIGGWNEASSRFSPMVASPERRREFVKNTIKFLRQNHFDGLDLDWEYPADRDGGKPRDKDNYAQFVQELREEFERESEKTGRPRLLLTMAVPAGIQYIQKGYDVPKLNKYLDWFNLLTYDYHNGFEPSVNHHAPLRALGEKSEYDFDSELNIDYSVKYYISKGADPSKLVLGIPTYGRSFNLLNAEATEIGAPADGAGEKGEATREAGFLAYYEICQGIKDDDAWTVVQPDSTAIGPYAFKDNLWVGYDDEAMARKKGEYVVKNGLGGIMFWTIDNDDFRGKCHGRPYPIIEAAKEAMLGLIGNGNENEVVTPSNKRRKPNRSRSRTNSGSKTNNLNNQEEEEKTTLAPRRSNGRRKPTPIVKEAVNYSSARTTTPEPPTTPDPGSDFKCEDEGFFPHPRDCKKYFWCLDSGPSNLGVVPHLFSCPNGLVFNKETDSCDYTRNVVCNKAPPTTTTERVTTEKTTRASSTQKSIVIGRPSSTTTEEPEEYEEEYEDDSEEDEKKVTRFEHALEEEDPEVIRDLITLIKRVGGLDELEKQLQMRLNVNLNGTTTTTVAPISQSLYNKVLGTKRGTIRPNTVEINIGANGVSETPLLQRQNKENRYSSVIRNSRPRPQNDGLDKLSEIDGGGVMNERPKYTVITRTQAPKAQNSDVDNESENHPKYSVTESSDDDDDDTNENKTPTTHQPTYQYVNIKRARPSSTTAQNDDEYDNEEHVQDEINPSISTSTTSRMQYVNIQRVRPTKPTYYLDEVESESPTPETKYKTVSRKRPTTTQISIVDEDHEQTESEPKYSTTVESVNNHFTLIPETTTRHYGSVSHRRTTTIQNEQYSTPQSSSSYFYPSTTIATPKMTTNIDFNNEYTNTPDYTTNPTSTQSSNDFSTVQTSTLTSYVVINSERNQNPNQNHIDNNDSFDVTTDNSHSVGPLDTLDSLELTETPSHTDHNEHTDTLTQTKLPKLTATISKFSFSSVPTDSDKHTLDNVEKTENDSKLTPTATIENSPTENYPPSPNVTPMPSSFVVDSNASQKLQFDKFETSSVYKPLYTSGVSSPRPFARRTRPTTTTTTTTTSTTTTTEASSNNENPSVNTDPNITINDSKVSVVNTVDTNEFDQSNNEIANLLTKELSVLTQVSVDNSANDSLNLTSNLIANVTNDEHTPMTNDSNPLNSTETETVSSSTFASIPSVSSNVNNTNAFARTRNPIRRVNIAAPVTERRRERTRPTSSARNLNRPVQVQSEQTNNLDEDDGVRHVTYKITRQRKPQTVNQEQINQSQQQVQNKSYDERTNVIRKNPNQRRYRPSLRDLLTETANGLPGVAENPDQGNRVYRPVQESDISSLTSIDLQNKNRQHVSDSRQRVSVRRRPIQQQVVKSVNNLEDSAVEQSRDNVRSFDSISTEAPKLVSLARKINIDTSYRNRFNAVERKPNGFKPTEGESPIIFLHKDRFSTEQPENSFPNINQTPNESHSQTVIPLNVLLQEAIENTQSVVVDSASDVLFREKVLEIQNLVDSYKTDPTPTTDSTDLLFNEVTTQSSTESEPIQLSVTESFNEYQSSSEFAFNRRRRPLARKTTESPEEFSSSSENSSVDFSSPRAQYQSRRRTRPSTTESELNVEISTPQSKRRVIYRGRVRASTESFSTEKIESSSNALNSIEPLVTDAAVSSTESIFENAQSENTIIESTSVHMPSEIEAASSTESLEMSSEIQEVQNESTENLNLVQINNQNNDSPQSNESIENQVNVRRKNVLIRKRPLNSNRLALDGEQSIPNSEEINELNVRTSSEINSRQRVLYRGRVKAQDINDELSSNEESHEFKPNGFESHRRRIQSRPTNAPAASFDSVSEHTNGENSLPQGRRRVNFQRKKLSTTEAPVEEHSVENLRESDETDKQQNVEKQSNVRFNANRRRPGYQGRFRSTSEAPAIIEVQNENLNSNVDIENENNDAVRFKIPAYRQRPGFRRTTTAPAKPDIENNSNSNESKDDIDTDEVSRNREIARKSLYRLRAGFVRTTSTTEAQIQEDANDEHFEENENVDKSSQSENQHANSRTLLYRGRAGYKRTQAQSTLGNNENESEQHFESEQKNGDVSEEVEQQNVRRLKYRGRTGFKRPFTTAEPVIDVQSEFNESEQNSESVNENSNVNKENVHTTQYRKRYRLRKATSTTEAQINLQESNEDEGAELEHEQYTNVEQSTDSLLENQNEENISDSHSSERPKSGFGRVSIQSSNQPRFRKLYGRNGSSTVQPLNSEEVPVEQSNEEISHNENSPVEPTQKSRTTFGRTRFNAIAARNRFQTKVQVDENINVEENSQTNENEKTVTKTKTNRFGINRKLYSRTTKSPVVEETFDAITESNSIDSAEMNDAVATTVEYDANEFMISSGSSSENELAAGITESNLFVTQGAMDDLVASTEHSEMESSTDIVISTEETKQDESSPSPLIVNDQQFSVESQNEQTQPNTSAVEKIQRRKIRKFRTSTAAPERVVQGEQGVQDAIIEQSSDSQKLVESNASVSVSGVKRIRKYRKFGSTTAGPEIAISENQPNADETNIDQSSGGQKVVETNDSVSVSGVKRIRKFRKFGPSTAQPETAVNDSERTQPGILNRTPLRDPLRLRYRGSRKQVLKSSNQIENDIDSINESNENATQNEEQEIDEKPQLKYRNRFIKPGNAFRPSFSLKSTTEIAPIQENSNGQRTYVRKYTKVFTLPKNPNDPEQNDQSPLIDTTYQQTDTENQSNENNQEYENHENDHEESEQENINEHENEELIESEVKIGQSEQEESIQPKRKPYTPYKPNKNRFSFLTSTTVHPASLRPFAKKRPQNAGSTADLDGIDLNALSLRNRNLFNSKKHTSFKPNQNTIVSKSSSQLTTNTDIENKSESESQSQSESESQYGSETDSKNTETIENSTFDNNSNYNENQMNRDTELENVNYDIESNTHTLSPLTDDDGAVTATTITFTNELNESFESDRSAIESITDNLNSINLENHLQEASLSSTSKPFRKYVKSTATTSTTIKPTTYHHVFAIDYDESPLLRGFNSNTNPNRNEINKDDPNAEVISKKVEKLAEVNRIVEVYSQQSKQTIQRSSNGKHKTKTSNLIIERLPTVDKLGEISRVTLIKLVDNQNQSKPLSHEFVAFITSTARPDTHIDDDTQSDKITNKLNAQSLSDKKARQIMFPDNIFSVETSTIPLEGLFQTDRNGKKLNIVYATTADDSYVRTSPSPVYIPKTHADTTDTTADAVQNDIHVVNADATPNIVKYNDSKPPLVISLANLDNVKLSQFSPAPNKSQPTKGNAYDGAIASFEKVSTTLVAPKSQPQPQPQHVEQSTNVDSLIVDTTTIITDFEDATQTESNSDLTTTNINFNPTIDTIDITDTNQTTDLP